MNDTRRADTVEAAEVVKPETKAMIDGIVAGTAPMSKWMASVDYSTAAGFEKYLEAQLRDVLNVKATLDAKGREDEALASFIDGRVHSLDSALATYRVVMQREAALASQAIPEGFVLAPKEPTEAMRAAGQWTISPNLTVSVCVANNKMAEEVYRAMLAAIPAAPEVKQMTDIPQDVLKAAHDAFVKMDDEVFEWRDEGGIVGADGTLQSGIERIVVRAILADRAARPAAVEDGPGEWRTIDSAPKDGTYLLVKQTGVLEPSVYVACFDGAWSDEGWWLVCDGKDPELPLRGPEPTHWMPLPAPPSPTEGEAR